MQATYLGYIGPVPLPELDWLICDRVTVPEAEAAHYRPAPLRLEGCYQANDGQRPLLPAVDRPGEGLPEAAFVFACASHFYKITEPLFAAWCRIVAAVPGSVLWLVADTPEGQAALAGRWQAAGLDPHRLIFAPRVDPARYRARLALADLFLDTMPYNAGTIASDALRMGLPLLTLAGRTFSGRMAASLPHGGGAGRLHRPRPRGLCRPRCGDRHRPGGGPRPDGARPRRALEPHLGRLPRFHPPFRGGPARSPAAPEARTSGLLRATGAGPGRDLAPARG